MLGQCRSSLLVQCRQIVYDAGPSAHSSNTGSTVYLAAVPQQTRAIHSILFQRWPTHKTALGDWPVFAWTAMRLPLWSSRRQKNDYPVNTMLGHHLWRWANIILTLSLQALITNKIVNIFFFLAFFKHATTSLSDIKRYIWHAHTDCSSKNVNRFPHTAPLFPQIMTKILLQ